MDYSAQYFGKDLESLGYQDIIEFFGNPQVESERLEFKSYHAQNGNFNDGLGNVIRAICAMLNSSGGIVIWGAPEGQVQDGQEVYQGALSPVRVLKEKDTVISKVSDSINTLPVGIKLSILQDRENYIYVFEVQESLHKPHQYRNIYYARLDGQTKPAPHYLVDALFKKISYPNLEGYIGITKYGPVKGNFWMIGINIVMLNCSELDNEYDVSYRLICPEAKFDVSFTGRPESYRMDGHEFIHKGYIDILHNGQPDLNNQRLTFNIEDLAASEYKMNLLLTFGGRKSPLKTSSYELDFSTAIEVPVDKNDLFSKIEENVYSADKQNEIDDSKEKLLKALIGR